MANHIRNMRRLRAEHGGNHRDILDGIPNFTMHIVRSTTAGYILELAGLPRGMASLMIAHELPGHHMSDLDRVGDTGKRYYGPMLCWTRPTSIMDYLPLLS